MEASDDNDQQNTRKHEEQGEAIGREYEWREADDSKDVPEDGNELVNSAASKPRDSHCQQKQPGETSSYDSPGKEHLQETTWRGAIDNLSKEPKYKNYDGQ